MRIVSLLLPCLLLGPAACQDAAAPTGPAIEFAPAFPAQEPFATKPWIFDLPRTWPTIPAWT